ncbi:MAG: carboxylating nicotinate-nucleotide diphosphorylase [Oscillospiraceae bacterium]|jgi:nicotinate-nucleotide pyrophosphorylase (carboxylating)|nr:carboxylating nicotinate-nucleotide diphosphorylase [Oscillospiraceae bacterium]
MLPWYTVDEVIQRALREDISYVDLSCEYLFDAEQRSRARFVAVRDGTLCGLDIALRVFDLLDSGFSVAARRRDGERFAPGDVLAEFEGSTVQLLQGERTALNLLQHLSGVASATARLVSLVAGTGAQITDTRKTLPGLRALQKYAVTCGGGKNHRFNLSDGVIIKDNHIDACGSIGAAVAAVRRRVGHMVKIEVETRNLAEVREALDAEADIIMLDNMSLDDMRAAVTLIRTASPLGASSPRKILLEASGDVTEENVRAVAETGVDIVSLGALTHSVKAANISMRIG